jgi:hypothetical protein
MRWSYGRRWQPLASPLGLSLRCNTPVGLFAAMPLFLPPLHGRKGAALRGVADGRKRGPLLGACSTWASAGLGVDLRVDLGIWVQRGGCVDPYLGKSALLTEDQGPRTDEDLTGGWIAVSQLPWRDLVQRRRTTTNNNNNNKTSPPPPLYALHDELRAYHAARSARSAQRASATATRHAPRPPPRQQAARGLPVDYCAYLAPPAPATTHHGTPTHLARCA